MAQQVSPVCFCCAGCCATAAAGRCTTRGWAWRHICARGRWPAQPGLTQQGGPGAAAALWIWLRDRARPQPGGAFQKWVQCWGRGTTCTRRNVMACACRAAQLLVVSVAAGIVMTCSDDRAVALLLCCCCCCCCCYWWWKWWWWCCWWWWWWWWCKLSTHMYIWTIAELRGWPTALWKLGQSLILAQGIHWMPQK